MSFDLRDDGKGLEIPPGFLQHAIRNGDLGGYVSRDEKTELMEFLDDSLEKLFTTGILTKKTSTPAQEAIGEFLFMTGAWAALTYAEAPRELQDKVMTRMKDLRGEAPLRMEED